MDASHSAWTPDGETQAKPTEDAITAAIAEVYDPEIPVNIYELGLIYAIEIADATMP
jgi:metal-sulfur cluster biosynthetic enzyme